MPEIPASGEPPPRAAEPDGLPPGPQPAYMVAVDQLTAHPGNVREDLDLTPQFLASVAETGVRIPLLVTPHDDGGFLVIEGHRRLAAAVQAGLAEVPCVLDPGRAGDQAGQFLDMVVANSDGHRRNFAPVEEAAALFAAHEAGASRTRIRKSTGRKAEDIKTALAAGKMSAETRAAAGDLAAQLTLDELALLAEFDGDPEAVAHDPGGAAPRAHRRVCGGADPPGPRRGRPARAAGRRAGGGRDHGHRRPAGRRCPPGRPGARRRGSHPGGPRRLPGPGRVFPVLEPGAPGALLRRPGRARAHGADLRPAARRRERRRGRGPGRGGRRRCRMTRPADAPPDPGRRLVIEGNKAWAAAGEVRRRWLPQLFARRAAPREVARFVAGQLLTMPEPLRLGLAAAPGQPAVHRYHRAARGPGRRTGATRARRSGCRC